MKQETAAEINAAEIKKCKDILNNPSLYKKLTTEQIKFITNKIKHIEGLKEGYSFEIYTPYYRILRKDNFY